jgi:hypothetical protein
MVIHKTAIGQIPIYPSVTNLTEEIIIQNLHRYTRFQRGNYWHICVHLSVEGNPAALHIKVTNHLSHIGA